MNPSEPDTFAADRAAAKTARAALLAERAPARLQAAYDAAAALALAMRPADLFAESRSYAVPAALLFAPALLALGHDWIRFSLPGSEPVDFSRTRLAEVAREFRRRGADVAVTVAPGVLRLRWRGGRGGLNLLSELVPRAAWKRVGEAMELVEPTVLVVAPPAVALPQNDAEAA